MITLFWLKLKSQRYLLVLLLVIVAFQVVMGQASSNVLAKREPPLSLAVQQLADDPLSHELVKELANVANFEVIEVDSRLGSDEVFRQVRVQALLIIPEGFEASIEEGKRAVVTLIPAPGITNREFAREQVANVVMQFRARHNLKLALGELGITDALEDELQTLDLLDVAYEGPGFQPSPAAAVPVHGVSALLILLAFLHAALTVPTREDKRIVIRGKAAFTSQLFASLFVVWLVWLLIIVLYFAVLTALVGTLPDPLACLAFVAIMLYVSLLAALLAQLIGRHATSWVFLPLFLLSMTIGVGLWASLIVSPALSPLVPVAAVIVAGSPTLLGAGVLLGVSALLLAVLLVMPFARLGLFKATTRTGARDKEHEQLFLHGIKDVR